VNVDKIALPLADMAELVNTINARAHRRTSTDGGTTILRVFEYIVRLSMNRTVD
jgi:hypothetical protein